MGGHFSQKLPKSNCKWVEDTSQFNDDVIKNNNEKSEERYFFKLMFNTWKNYMNFKVTYHF